MHGPVARVFDADEVPGLVSKLMGGGGGGPCTPASVGVDGGMGVDGGSSRDLPAHGEKAVGGMGM